MVLGACLSRGGLSRRGLADRFNASSSWVRITGRVEVCSSLSGFRPLPGRSGSSRSKFLGTRRAFSMASRVRASAAGSMTTVDMLPRRGRRLRRREREGEIDRVEEEDVDEEDELLEEEVDERAQREMASSTTAARVLLTRCAELDEDEEDEEDEEEVLGIEILSGEWGRCIEFGGGGPPRYISPLVASEDLCTGWGSGRTGGECSSLTSRPDIDASMVGTLGDTSESKGFMGSRS